MSEDTSSNSSGAFKWRKPEEAMTLHLLKKKKKALQARISTPTKQKDKKTRNQETSENNKTTQSNKRKNPFLCQNTQNTQNEEEKEEEGIQIQIQNKRSKLMSSSELSQDSTLFTLFKFTNSNSRSFSTIHSNQNEEEIINERGREEEIKGELVKAAGKKKIPVDWSLKTKVRLMSLEPFNWNQQLKTSEEASGTTGFARCLDILTNTNNSLISLDTSSNAKFHQCCLFWQHPFIPWLDLFPRGLIKASSASLNSNLSLNVPNVKESLHSSFSDSFRNLFQLLRTRQCAYFYLCSNSYTVLFRAAGVAGKSEMNALITPTTRGFRHTLKQEEIEFTMPLKTHKSNKQNENNEDEEEEDQQEHWLKSMGIKEEDIKQINFTEERIQQKLESEVDNSEQSLVYVEGVEVQALYNFLINCKSVISSTGPFAGIPPTLLAPVAFQGGTLNSLKVRQSRVHNDQENYYSLELTGPILPHMVHNLFAINPSEKSITATFVNLNSTLPFSKISSSEEKGEKGEGKEEEDKNLGNSSSSVFGKAGLSDCGLSETIIDRFCLKENKGVTNLECIKYSSEDKTYSWT